MAGESLLAPILERSRSVLAVLQRAPRWTGVRRLASFHLLTRASYAALLAVPLLASLWPAVRILVNQHNRGVTEASQLLSVSAARLENAVLDVRTVVSHLDSLEIPGSAGASTAIEELAEAARTTVERLRRYSADYSERTIDTPQLPWTLAATFLAALAVATGQFVFQIFCPDAVQEDDEDQFVEKRRKDVAASGSTEAVNRARRSLNADSAPEPLATVEQLWQSVVDLHESGRASRLKQIVVRAPDQAARLAEWLQLQELESDLRTVPVLLGQLLASAATEESRIALVESAALVEFGNLDRRAPIAILAATSLYLFALVLVGRVIFVQARSVIEAAGIRSLGNVFGQ